MGQDLSFLVGRSFTSITHGEGEVVQVEKGYLVLGYGNVRKRYSEEFLLHSGEIVDPVKRIHSIRRELAVTGGQKLIEISRIEAEAEAARTENDRVREEGELTELNYKIAQLKRRLCEQRFSYENLVIPEYGCWDCRNFSPTELGCSICKWVICACGACKDPKHKPIGVHCRGQKERDEFIFREGLVDLFTIRSFGGRVTEFKRLYGRSPKIES